MANNFQIFIKRLPHGLDHPLPAYATLGSAGMDLVAAIPSSFVLLRGHRHLVSTGLAIALPEGYEAQVRSRSGLALKHGLQVLNAPGTIDSDYRGEIKVILINHGSEDFTIEPGMRIAQLVVASFQRVNLVEADDFDRPTQRAAQGFGSTGY